jgi:hypothetical protein
MLLTILFITFYLNSVAAVSTKIDFYPTEVTQSIIQYNNSLNYSLNDVFSLKANSFKMQKNELIGFVSSLNKHAHSPINFINVITNYNPSFFDFYTNMQMILYEDYDQSAFIDNYFNSVNEQLDDFSDYTKAYCLDTTTSVLKYFNFLEEVSSTTSAEKGPKVEENNIHTKTKVKRAFLFATAAAAFATGDIVTPVTVAADMLSNASPKEKPNAKANANLSQNLTIMSPDTFLTYSKLFCINTFSLQFSLDNNNELTIVGDKINYDYFIDFTNYIQDRLAYIQDRLASNKDVSGPKNIWEQVEALKRVAIKMDELVVYELYDRVYDISRSRHNPFSKLKSYISSKLRDIDRLKNFLEADFPITKLDLLEQVRLNTATRLINAQIKEEALKKHADELSNVRQESDQRVSKNTLQNELNANEFDAFASLYVYGPLKRTTGLLTRAVIALPEGITVGGLHGIYDFLGSIYNIFSGSPVTTGFITVISLAVIYSSVANIFSIVFNFVSWIFFPFLFIKKLIC